MDMLNIAEYIKSTKFSFEQSMKDKVILKFSAKQGGDFFVFSFYWQCFVWAAMVGFKNDLREPLTSPLAERNFNLNTISNNDGDKAAKALICMVIAKAGTLDILKEPEKVITMINEYANGGFHYIAKMMNNESIANDFEFVKKEVFSREVE